MITDTGTSIRSTNRQKEKTNLKGITESKNARNTKHQNEQEKYKYKDIGKNERKYFTIHNI